MRTFDIVFLDIKMIAGVNVLLVCFVFDIHGTTSGACPISVALALKTKHEFAKKTLKYNLPYTINNTPHIVKDKVNTHSFQGFSLYVKQYLIRKYNTNCISLNCYICEQNA